MARMVAATAYMVAHMVAAMARMVAAVARKVAAMAQIVAATESELRKSADVAFWGLCEGGWAGRVGGGGCGRWRVWLGGYGWLWLGGRRVCLPSLRVCMQILGRYEFMLHGLT